MNLKTIIKKLTETPEKFDKLIIEMERKGKRTRLTAVCSNDPFSIWRSYDGKPMECCSILALIRTLRTVYIDENAKYKLIFWQELDDDEAFD